MIKNLQYSLGVKLHTHTHTKMFLLKIIRILALSLVGKLFRHLSKQMLDIIISYLFQFLKITRYTLF